MPILNRHCERLTGVKQSHDNWKKIASSLSLLAMTLTLLTLTACQATQKTPTSDRLVGVKGMRLSAIRNEMLTQNHEFGQPVFLRIFKEDQVLEAWVKEPKSEEYELFKTYDICKFSGQLGPKLAEGDGQAPEGFYEIGADQLNPWSQYHLSFNLGFPNEYDRARLRTGSNLMVHGGCKSIGCYAITDHAMEEVYLMTEASIQNGHNVPVHIFPFRMTDTALRNRGDSLWYEEWQNLRIGYDAFERTKTPPTAEYDDHKYVFEIDGEVIKTASR